jgi:hypothetical protein
MSREPLRGVQNKDTLQLLRAAKKHGAVIRNRNGALEVLGPRGRLIVHKTVSRGCPQGRLRNQLRGIGLPV